MALVLMAGASGALGTPLRAQLLAGGHTVRQLVRRPPRASHEVGWNPHRDRLPTAALEGVEAVVNLAGAGIADRPWTRARRAELLASRLNPTRTLVDGLLRHRVEHGHAPRLLQGTAIGWYGTESGATPYDESAPAGGDFVAQLVRRWEEPLERARSEGLHVITARTAIVLAGDIGPVPLMKIPFSLGLGANFGDGHQHLAAISRHDWLRAMRWLLDSPTADGVYNLTLPEPTTSGELSDTLARLLRRPRLLAVPAPVLRLALRDMADLLLGDQYVVPARLLAAGFTFDDADLTSALRRALTPVADPPADSVDETAA